LYIVGYKDIIDNKYYVPLTLESTLRIAPNQPLKINLNFLIDTGASATQLSWNDANFAGIIIRTLQQDNSVYSGIGGSSYQGYLLPGCKLFFKTNKGRLIMPLNTLSVMDFQTISGEFCPASSSILGIDILNRFDLLFEDDYLFLRYKRIN
jgi:hypothetical protein